MTPSLLVWLTLGAFLVYIVSQDANVYDWLVLKSRHFWVWFQRQWFRIRHHPDSPLVRFEIKRNSERLAREILKENERR